MKTKQILMVIAAMIIAGAIFVAGIIRSDAQTVSVIEKRVGNTVYKLKTSDNIYTLANKANKITGPELSDRSIFSFDNSELAYKDWTEHFKSVFSKERAKELNVRIDLGCICDSTGQIIEVRSIFAFREIYEMFTLSEIKAIEDAAKKYRIPFTAWRGGKSDKYVSVVYTLNPYLIYFDKSK